MPQKIYLSSYPIFFWSWQEYTCSKSLIKILEQPVYKSFFRVFIIDFQHAFSCNESRGWWQVSGKCMTKGSALALFFHKLPPQVLTIASPDTQFTFLAGFKQRQNNFEKFNILAIYLVRIIWFYSKCGIFYKLPKFCPKRDY